MLLIITNKRDLTADYLILRMRERGVPFLRLNTEDFGSSFHLSIVIDSGKNEGWIHLRDGAAVSLTQIAGAYIRRPGDPCTPADVEDGHREFAHRELLEMLRAFWALIPDRCWLNTPVALRSAAIKTRQLLAASRRGLRVPPTCISDHSETITRFAGEWSRPLVTKAVRSGFATVAAEARLAATIRLPEGFPSDLDNYARIPATYQPEIRKLHDLRVTVVDDQVFAAAIHSQDHLATQTDWRVSASPLVELRHEPVELESDVREACCHVTRDLGLRFSAIDMIRAEDGSVVFLEANPNGEWMWIDTTCNLPIRDAIIDALKGPKL